MQHRALLYLAVVIIFGLSGCERQSAVSANRPATAKGPGVTSTMASISDVPTVAFRIPTETATATPGATATATVPAPEPGAVAFNLPTATAVGVEATETLEPTLVATEAPDEISVGSTCVVFESTVVYGSPGGEEAGTVDAGRFTIIGEEGGFWHIRHERGAEGWVSEGQNTYGLEGTVPPEGEGPAQEVAANIPREIVFGGGELEIVNQSDWFYVDLVSDAWREDRSVAYGAEARAINKAKLETALSKYNTDVRTLRIVFDTFSSPAPISPNASNLVRQSWERQGDVVIFYVSIDEDYDPSFSFQQQRALFDICSGVVTYLFGSDDGKFPSAEQIQTHQDITALVLPAIFSIFSVK